MELIIGLLILGTGLNIFIWFIDATARGWLEAIRNTIVSEIAILAVSFGVYFITKGC